MESTRSPLSTLTPRAGAGARALLPLMVLLAVAAATPAQTSPEGLIVTIDTVAGHDGRPTTYAALAAEGRRTVKIRGRVELDSSHPAFLDHGRLAAACSGRGQQLPASPGIEGPILLLLEVVADGAPRESAWSGSFAVAEGPFELRVGLPSTSSPVDYLLTVEATGTAVVAAASCRLESLAVTGRASAASIGREPKGNGTSGQAAGSQQAAGDLSGGAADSGPEPRPDAPSCASEFGDLYAAYDAYLERYQRLIATAAATPISDPPELRSVQQQLFDVNRSAADDRSAYQEHGAVVNRLNSLLARTLVESPAELAELSRSYMRAKACYEELLAASR